MRIQRLRKFLPIAPGKRPLHPCLPFLLLLVLVVTGLPALSGAQPTCPPNGDVDQNGSVTAADALLVFQQALGLAQLNGCQQTIADVFPQPGDPDGNITASDALCIFQKALSLPSCLDSLPSANQLPVVDAGSDQSVDAGVMVFLLGAASDPDGTIASHAWTQTGGTAVSLTGADAATAVFVAPDVQADETLTFRLTVTDDGGAQASDEIRVTVQPLMQPTEQASAAEVFRQAISAQIVQMKCVNCHVQSGASGNTRLVFVGSDTPDHELLNLRAFEDLLAKVADEGGGSYVLNKMQGVGHGGGVQVSPGTPEFANMQRFLSLLGEEVAPPAPVTVETLFDTVLMASPRKTLRRAALIFAGRIPTDEEYAAVEGGDERALRAAIRGLMEGPQFHEFLIRASNDRLLTDREGDVLNRLFGFLVDFTNEVYRRTVAVGGVRNQDFWDWHGAVQYGARRAPLELIAHVVENDLPYAEILTADYIMANPAAAGAYGASTQFDNFEDVHEFKPSRIVSYYRKGPEYESEFDQAIDATRVLNPGPLLTHYPHAGILNTNAFLFRYPTTATNRNRARARWTYYHFLGLDVEKSASRTTDPVALADTNNPTMHNAACTVCHGILDPVAGAFQNHGDEGWYKDQWGGLDSLDEFYKNEGGPSLTVRAESWTERETLVWPVSLTAGIQTLRVTFTNPFPDENADRFVYLDRLEVTNGAGEVIAGQEFEELEPPGAECGWTLHNPATGHRDHIFLHGDGYRCAIFIDIHIPVDGVYNVGVVAWAYPNVYAQYGDNGFAKLSVMANAYEEGDTWYRDMRIPGFADEAAPHPDNSLQWLAQQIVADPRFAEAAVKFWWPAIMGSEVAEPPEDAADTDFGGRLLAASAQNAELVRLADGFRGGFQGSPYTYNLKDLLVEIILSKWFRADTIMDTDPVRRVALHDAGAKRLLTPEELARKTAAITGVQWGRRFETGSLNERSPSELTEEYRLLYGGIDSDGITERARNITSVMAGVAKRHAAEVSCPAVMRELYLLREEKRRLFAGIDPNMTPVSEFGDTFEITAASQSEMETLSLQGHLTAGEKTVSLAFLNDYHETREKDRDILLDRLTVRQGTTVVHRYEMENLDPPVDCHHIEQGAFHLSGSGPRCVLAVPVPIPSDGVYQIEILAWGDQAGDELPRLRVVVESDTADSAGSNAIRNKLVELYDKLLGVEVAPHSPNVEATYRFFVDVWQQHGRQAQGDGWFDIWWWRCRWDLDHLFFEGILDDAMVAYEDEHGRRYEFDRDRINDFLDGIDFSDPSYTAQTWVVVLAAMMMDYRYLYL